ncbi:MAG: hypothetical protein ACO3RU_06780, partial [Planctomycetota bacterium]
MSGDVILGCELVEQGAQRIGFRFGTTQAERDRERRARVRRADFVELGCEGCRNGGIGRVVPVRMDQEAEDLGDTESDEQK